MSGKEQKALFAEWTEDYAARREIDFQEREAKAAALPPRPWPSEIAEANRQKPIGQDAGVGIEHEDGYSL